ncbi:MAG: hydrogenase iron-sulfur subunit [candidate division WOR-3 bacterium]|nr:hydrogenase iron-sulfur subunit [candidate division WOR-3 bacterium]MCX7837328.1 hydrogenase iron-sulfur subunit [candidate division WOR-3 bacterium]MDW8114609.1 hydrogenase iron-sulfur subunit [candidate division WOR-3 bacterium]
MGRIKIVGFACNWCCYAGADLAGTSHLKYAPEMRLIRVLCSGRIDPKFILNAFKNGADGVFIGACHPGDCHYQTGNLKTIKRVMLLKKYLKQLGIEEDRLCLEFISASEGEKFQKVANQFVEKIKSLGPLNWR